jgi:hypothetical protein
MSRRFFALPALLLLFLVPRCFADTFAWSYNGVGVNASGTFTATPNTDGTFQITDISGERNGVPITGLSTFGFANNLIYPFIPFFDYSGLSFVAGGTEFNVYGTIEHAPEGDRAFLTEGFITFNPDRNVIFTELTEFTLSRIAEVPEPATLLLFSTGLIGLIYRLRKSRSNPPPTTVSLRVREHRTT